MQAKRSDYICKLDCSRIFVLYQNRIFVTYCNDIFVVYYTQYEVKFLSTQPLIDVVF